MNQKQIGALGVLLSGLCLSAELYALPWLQALDREGGGFHTSPWQYAVHGPAGLALVLTLAALAVSAWFAIKRGN